MPKEIKEKIEDWEKKFDEKFGYKDDPNKLNQWGSANIKSFIRQLLSQQNQKLVEEIKCFIDGIYIGDSKELATGIKNINIFLKELTQIINPK